MSLQAKQDSSIYDVADLSWTGSDPNTQYVIEITAPSGSSPIGVLMQSPQSAMVYLPDNLPELTEVAFRIHPSGAAPSSAGSNIAQYFRGPRPVTGAYQQASSGLQLVWNNTSAVATSVSIRRAQLKGPPPSASDYTAVATLAPVMPVGNEAGHQSFLDSAVAECTDYDYLFTVNAGAYQSMDYELQARSGLLTPSGLQVSQQAGGVQLTWQNNSQAATGQTVYRYGSKTSMWLAIATLSPSANSFLDASAGPGDWAYEIAATDSAPRDESRSAPAELLAADPGSPLAFKGTVFDNLPPGGDSLNLQRLSDGTWCMAAMASAGLGLRDTSGNWSWQPYPVAYSGQSRVTLDPTGSAHLLLCEYSGTPLNPLHYLSLSQGVWTDAVVTDGTTQAVALDGFTIDGLGTPHAIFWSSTSPSTFGNGGTTPWTFETAPSNLATAQALLTGDAQGGLWMVDPVSGHLVAHTPGASWQDMGAPAATNNLNNFALAPCSGGVTIFWSIWDSSAQQAQVWSRDVINGTWGSASLVFQTPSSQFAALAFKVTADKQGRQMLVLAESGDLGVLVRQPGSASWSLGPLGVRNTLFMDYQVGSDANDDFWIAALTTPGSGGGLDRVLVYAEGP